MPLHRSVSTPAQAEPVPGDVPRTWLLVLWPAFVMAGVLEMLVFALIDPASLTGFSGVPVQWSASAVYSVAFLLFWVVIASSTTVTLLLARRSA